ncbi:MAG: KEOPS complex subunit Pcc1 [Halovenus sp.]
MVTDHDDRETALAVARSVRPDNTAELTTREEAGTVVTTITRGSTGGLQSTVDDYVVNVAVAAQLLEQPKPTHDT